MYEIKRKQLFSALGGLDCTSNKRLHAYRTNLVKDKNPMIFDDRMKDTLLAVALQPNMVKEEIKYLDKIGFTQSCYQYEQIQAALEKFSMPNHPYFGWNKHYQHAKKALINEVSRWSCRTVEYHSYDIDKFIPKLNTHAGFSYLLDGKRRKGDYVEGMFREYIREEDRALKLGTFGKPILLGSRTTGSGAYDKYGERTYTFKKKTRLVSMVDIWQVMCERRFQYPLQGHLGASEWYAGGKSDRDIAEKLQWARSNTNYWISIDYSSYDQTVSKWLIYDAFDILKHAFCNLSDRDSRLLDIIRDDFTDKMFVAGHGEIILSNKGIPSGSMFTQIIGSIINRLMILTYLTSIDTPLKAMLVMGDDNIFFTNDRVDRYKLASYLQRNFGVITHGDKCSEGTHNDYPEFLSRVWADRVLRQTQTLIYKLCYPEHFREYDKIDEDPITIILQYMENFPGGMDNLIDYNKLRGLMKERNYNRKRSGDLLLSGLAAYRATFDRRVSN